MPEIDIQNLTKTFHIYERPIDRLWQSLLGHKKQFARKFNALSNVSLTIERGTTLGIVGKNGSGKSTLLQLICGVLTPTEGQITVNGSIGSLLELGAGFDQELSGIENIRLVGTILGNSADEVAAKQDEIIDFAELGDFIHQPVKTYSSGMYMRLAFSINALMDPDILIVDEALAVGDAYFTHKCMLKFKRLQQSGKTIIFVSHDANAVRNLCTKVIWLNEGSIVKGGEPGDVIDEYLRFISDIPTVEEKQGRALAMDQSSFGKDESQHEYSLPEVLDRSGDQSLAICGVGLYSANGQPIHSTLSGEQITVRVTFENRKLELPTELVIGYVLRDIKGMEIASGNNIGEGVVLVMESENDIATCSVSFTVPIVRPTQFNIIHAGKQSFEIILHPVSHWRLIRINDTNNTSLNP